MDILWEAQPLGMIMWNGGLFWWNSSAFTTYPFTSLIEQCPPDPLTGLIDLARVAKFLGKRRKLRIFYFKTAKLINEIYFSFHSFDLLSVVFWIKKNYIFVFRQRFYDSGHSDGRPDCKDYNQNFKRSFNKSSIKIEDKRSQ